MADPIILSDSPVDGASGSKSVHGEFKLTVDDTDSSINVSSLNIQGYYATEYEESYDFTTKVVGNFRDTGANPTKQTSADIITYSDNRIEMTVNQSDGDFNSGLFFPVENKNTEGFGFSAQLHLSTFSAASSGTVRPYYNNANFTGVSMGVFDFKTGNAVILLFNTGQEIVIAGPASDGVGTRVTNTVSYNWTTETIFCILADYSADKVTVTATKNESDEDTILYSGSISSLGTCLSSVALANRFKDSNTDVIGFVSQDGRQVGDLVIIRKFSVYPYSYGYVVNGSFTSKVLDGKIISRDSHIANDNKNHNFLGWETSNVRLYKSNIYDAVEFYAAAGHVKKQYQDLDNNTFFIYTEMHTTENVFSGVNSGIGIDIMGSKQFSIRFLDGYIGIRTSNDAAAKRTLAGYTRYPIDISKNAYYLFYCDGTTFTARTGLGDGTSRISWFTMFSVAVAALPSSSSRHIALVSEAGLSGSLFLDDFVFSPTSGPYIVRQQSVNTTTAVQQGSFTYPISSPTAGFKYYPSVGGISANYIQIPKYSPSYSGVVCLFSFSFTDSHKMQPGVNYGPFLLLNTDKPAANTVTHSLRLMLTKGFDGRTYMYFPGDQQDSVEVAYQTNKGKSISVALNNKYYIELCIRYIPTVGLSVYDVHGGEFKRILFIQESDIDGSHHLLPNINAEGVYLPTDIANDNHFVAAVGVLEPGDVRLAVNYLVVGVGRGVDVSFFKDTDSLPVASIYGNPSRFLVTAEDND